MQPWTVMANIGQFSGNSRYVRACHSKCNPEAEASQVNGVLIIGDTSKSVCEFNVDINKTGVVLIGGLNRWLPLPKPASKLTTAACVLF